MRFFAVILPLVVPVVLISSACSDDTSTTSSPPDAGSGSFDANVSSDSGGDRDVPVADGSIQDAALDVVDAADAADAAPTTVMPFATGLDAAGTTVLADGQVDTHWTVKDQNGTALTAYVQTDALGYPGYWLAPSTTSKFISPFTDTVDPTGMGTFTYKTTFSLRAGIDLSTVSLVIKVANDNDLMEVSVNTQAVAGVVAGSYASFQTLNATTGFVVGTNTVEIIVGNSGGPTGMRAELTLTAP